MRFALCAAWWLVSGFHAQAKSRFLALPYMDPPDPVDDRAPEPQYSPDPAHVLRCLWNNSALSAAAQDSLLLHSDNTTLICFILHSRLDPTDPRQIDVTRAAVVGLEVRLRVDNGSSGWERVMPSQTYSLAEYGVWTTPINRSALGAPKRATWLPWTATVRVVNRATGAEVDYLRFTIVDPYSDAYLSWLWGNPVSVSDFRSSVSPGGKALTIRNPCVPQMIILIRSVLDTAADRLRIYFSISWSMHTVAFTGWRKVLTISANCTLTRAVGLPSYIVLHTQCGAYVTERLNTLSTGNDKIDSAPRTLNFARAPVLDAMATDPAASVSDYCYLRTSSKIGSVVTMKNGSGISGLVFAPFKEFISPLQSYQPQEKQSPLADVRSAFYQTVQSNPAAIIATFLQPSTNVYYILYRAPTNRLTLFSQPLSDMLTSTPSGSIVFAFPPDTTFLPLRFVSHPLTQHLYLVGNQIWWSADGQGFVLLHALPETVSEVSFSPGGTEMVVRGSGGGVWTGGAVSGALFPVGCGMDGNKAVTFGPDDGLYVLDVATTGGVTPCSVQREVTVAGNFALVPLTSTMFYLVEWDTASGPGKLGDQWIGFEFLHASNYSRSQNDYDRGTVVAHLPGTALTHLPTGPKNLLLIEQTTPLLFSASDLSMAPLAANQTLTITLSTPSTATFALSTSGTDWSSAVPLYATILAEQRDPNGNVVLRASFIITALNPAAGAATTPVTGGASGPIQVPPGQWMAMSLGNSDPTAPAWMMRDDVREACPYVLIANQSVEPVVNVFMDRGDMVTLLISLRPTFSRSPTRHHSPLLPNSILTSRPASPRLRTASKLTGSPLDGYDLLYTIEEVGLTSQTDFWAATLTFTMTHPSAACRRQMIVVNVVSGCLKGSGLRYVFPDGMDDAEVTNTTRRNKVDDPVVGPIPVNYRPPTDAEGIDFPTSPHIYNADPSRPVRTHFAGPDEHPAVWKHCDGCCSEEMRWSMLVANSDCLREAVYLPFSGDHVFQLRLYTDAVTSGLLSPDEPVMLTELNNRTAFVIGDTAAEEGHSTLELLRAHRANGPDRLVASNSSIRFTGTGLFHFRVSALPESSYCALSTEFILWLYTPPLAFPMAAVCQVLTLLLISLWLFFVLKNLGETTLLDRRRRTAERMPDRIPLVDSSLGR